MMNALGLGSLKKLASSATTKSESPPPTAAPKAESSKAICSTSANGAIGKVGLGARSSNNNGGDVKGDEALNGVIPVVDPARIELEELKEKANEVANESLASTKRMTEFCEQAKDAGIKIIVALDDQKEQLDRVQDSLTVMREDLISAEKNLKGMEKCCGIFNNPFKKPNYKDDETLWKNAGDGVVLDSVPRRPFTPSPQLSWPLNKSSSSKDHNNSSNNPGGMAGGYIPRITEDEVEDAMEKNMDLVSSMLGNLRNMAIDMNTEIESQNKQMNVINDMTEQNNARIDDAIKRTHDLKRQ